jgi:hypothetical protein
MSPLARTTAGVLLLVCAALLAGPVRAANSGDVRNAVVKITSTGPDGQRRSGAGFIVKLEADAVFIVTAAHVVEGDKTPRVELFTRPLPVKAEVAQLDLQLDVALLVVHGRDSPLSGLRSLPLDLAGSSAVGQDVTTIGFPAGLSWALSKLRWTRAGQRHSGRDGHHGATRRGSGDSSAVSRVRVAGLAPRLGGCYGCAAALAPGHSANPSAHTCAGPSAHLGARARADHGARDPPHG